MPFRRCLPIALLSLATSLLAPVQAPAGLPTNFGRVSSGLVWLF